MRYRRVISILFLFCFPALAQTVVETQEVRELKPTGTLGTCGYAPTAKEDSYFKKLPPEQKSTGSFMDEHPFHLQGWTGQFVSWFGVVRGISAPNAEKTYRLLLENKYFDGLSDCHIMLVSNAGGGDFVVSLNVRDAEIPALSLVRVYGKVTQEQGQVPYVDAQYIRVWPWFTFTFTDLGPANKGNSRWAKYCKMCKGGRVYNPYPNEKYYLNMLGDPKDFGTMLKGVDF